MEKRDGGPAAAENPAPKTLEGYFVLHQFFRLQRRGLQAVEPSLRDQIIDEACAELTAMAAREDGDSAMFSQLGHKGDLILIHFRRTLDELAEAERMIGDLGLSDFLEQSSSYLSVVEIGLYESTV